MVPRIALLILTASIAIGVTSAQAGAPLPVKGDFTCDSHANAEDSLALLTYLGNLPSQGPKNCAAVGTVAHATNGMIAWESNGEIYTMNADGSNQTNITNDGAYDWYPMWSHDGKHLAFSSNRDGGTDHLFVVDPDGGNIRQITTASNDDDTPNWSPDDRQIVFNSYNGNDNDIYVVNADGTHRHGILTGSHDDFYPTWSPDGKHILFSSDRGATVGDLYTSNPDGANVQLLFHNDTYKALPSYSPDGTKIAYSSFDGTKTNVYVIPSNGSGQPTDVSNGAYRDAEPGWSPDGNFILFETTRNDPHPDTCDPCNYDIYRIDASGTHSTRLTEIDGTNENGVWQPIPTDIEGDLTCDNIVDVQDLLASLAATAGLDPHLPSGCPPITP